jgi:hypothetical protein
MARVEGSLTLPDPTGKVRAGLEQRDNLPLPPSISYTSRQLRSGHAKAGKIQAQEKAGKSCGFW